MVYILWSLGFRAQGFLLVSRVGVLFDGLGLHKALVSLC